MIANGYTEAAKTSQLISLSSKIYSFLTRFLVAYNIFLCYNEIRNIFSYVKLTAKLVMSKHPKFIKKLLEIILQIKVRDIRFHETEKNLKESYDGHGIRFDLYVEDSDNTNYFSLSF